MRQKVEIKIKKNEVYEEVKKTCEYEAQNAMREGKSFEKVRVEDANDELLDSYWNEAQGITEGMLKDYLTDASEEEETVTGSADKVKVFKVELSMPSNYSSQMTGAVEMQMFLMIVYYMLSKWMARVLPDSEKRFSDAVVGATESIMINLRKRDRPKRLAVPDDVDEPYVKIEYSEIKDESGGGTTGDGDGTGGDGD